MAEEPANTPVETVSKADHEAAIAALKVQLTDAQNQYKGMQRELARARQAGTSTERIERKVDAALEFNMALAENIEKAQKGEQVSLDVAPYKKLLSDSASEAALEKRKENAGTSITTLFERAGISREQFDTVWGTDERFKVANTLWTQGKFDESIAAVTAALVQPKVEPKMSDEDVKQKVEAEIARRAAAAIPAAATLAGGKGKTLAELNKVIVSKLSNIEFAQFQKDYDEALQRSK